MTARIREFLKQRQDEGPCLVLDLDVVRENYLLFAKALPDTRVFYAVKANPAPEVLKLLAELGSCFDVASVSETEAVLAAGATPERISYGNTIKKESEIARGLRLGVTLFAVDCEAEVEKVARCAPGARVICRIHCDGTGLGMAALAQVRLRAGLCRRHPGARAPARARRARHLVPRRLAAAQRRSLGPRARLDRGDLPHLRRARHHACRWSISAAAFPANYVRKTPQLETYGKAIFRALRRHFGNARSGDHRRAGPRPRRQCRHHRGGGGADRQALAGGRAALGLSRHRQVPRARRDHRRIDPLSRSAPASDRDEMAPCIIAGPTCDSVDVLYEKNPYPLPVSLAIGDKVLIEATGAYTATYSSVGFNGYPPLRQYVI